MDLISIFNPLSEHQSEGEADIYLQVSKYNLILDLQDVHVHIMSRSLCYRKLFLHHHHLTFPRPGKLKVQRKVSSRAVGSANTRLVFCTETGS